MSAKPDWLEWYKGYDTSPDRRARLRFVQTYIHNALNAYSKEPINIISLCAGDGRDLIPVLNTHPRRAHVRGTLVEMNPTLVTRGRSAIEAAALLDQLSYLEADATLSSTYEHIAPADMVIVAGIFGNLLASQVPLLIQNLPALCNSDAFVIWTRHRRYNNGMEQIPIISKLLQDNQFEPIRFDTTSDTGYSVGMNRYVGSRKQLILEKKWFEFGTAT